MRSAGVRGFALFFVGVIFYETFGFLWGLSAPPPQWFLLVVLALGSRGHIDTAQTLGFFWGLVLDVQAGTLFGSQAWVLAAAGYATGILSRHVDAEKPMAQAVLACFGTFFHLSVMAGIEILFRQTGSPHVASLGHSLVQLFMNAAAAPLVFAGTNRMFQHNSGKPEDHVFRP